MLVRYEVYLRIIVQAEIEKFDLYVWVSALSERLQRFQF